MNHTKELRHTSTDITLPPGPIPNDLLHKILVLIFEQYRWFEPERYGFPVPEARIPPARFDLRMAIATYDRFKSVSIGGRTDQDYLMIFSSKPGDFPYAGSMTWTTSQHAPEGSTWHAEHISQVHEVMKLTGSPLAYTAINENRKQKTERWLRDELGEFLGSTVRDYSEGLAGLFWRNFYGPPFVRLFGERLNTLPPECVTRLGEEFVLVQPYELPTEAGTEAARAREQQLISLLGPECFYDHEHHRPPTRRPVLAPPPWPPPAT